MNWFTHSLYESAAMFWDVLWALVLGFSISALLQVYISKERMTRELGQTNLRSVGLATLFGAASSSCSYAATAAGRSAFQKGASLVATLAFMFASTNLVLELGVILWILMGWHFVLAELVGSFMLIGLMWLLVRFILPQGLEEEAREHAGAAEGKNCHESSSHSKNKLQQVADAFVMDWSMLWKEMLIGFLISGFLAVLVPEHIWRSLFLSQNATPWLRLLENVVVGPLIAVLSFVCSVGNIPLASVLWSGGISFGGVISFIYADLVIIPLVLVYRKYYGARPAAYITGILFASMVGSGALVELLFSALGLIPSGPRPASAISQAHFAWNYTTWLDLLAILVGLTFLYVRRKEPQSAPAEAHSCCHQEKST